MSDYLERLARTEAAFRAEVIDGLRREAQRLRDHQVLAPELPAVGLCLGQLATTLLDVAKMLRAQDGHLDAALELERGGAGRNCASSAAAHSLVSAGR